jgi:uncharacterized membrane protein YhaH (DUF805 family)
VVVRADSRRYGFRRADWKGALRPRRGTEIDFIPEEGRAMHLFPVASPPDPFTWRKHLFSFRGRTPRFDYWVKGILLWSFALIVALAIDIALIQTHIYSDRVPWLTVVVYILLFWPRLALEAKRCHDRNKTGFFFLLAAIPLVNIWVLVELWFLRGTPGDNDYGPDPLGAPITAPPTAGAS